MLEAEQKMAKERAEHEKHLSVLHSTLPKSIADRVARGETVNDHYDNAAVIFLDIVGFTTISEQLSSIKSFSSSKRSLQPSMPSVRSMT